LEKIILDTNILIEILKNNNRTIKEVEKFVERFRSKASKAVQVQSRVKMLEKMGSLEQLVNERILGLSFDFVDTHSKVLSEVDNVSFSYSEGPKLIKDLSFTINKNDRIGIIGKNGKGKSSLLNILASNLSPTSGSVVNKKGTIVGHFGQTNIDRLSPKSRVVDEITSINENLPTSRVRAICGSMMFEGDLALKKIEVLSGGEKGRVLLGKLVASRHNLLLLDEPTNHLDMESTLALVNELKKFKGAVVIVSHNEEILRALTSKLIIFEREETTVFDGGYDSFLEKIGWESEVSENRGKKDKISKKDIKRQRSALIKERSSTLIFRIKLVEKIEQNISNLENLVELKNREIVNLSGRSGDGAAISFLSKEVSSHELEIEGLFLKLENESERLESEDLRFQKLLETVEN